MRCVNCYGAPVPRTPDAAVVVFCRSWYRWKHEWSVWGPVEFHMLNSDGFGQNFQTRTCLRCNLAQERVV